LTLQTFKGAVKMVENATLPIETLVDNVCSKGGTTIQAVDCFRESNLEGIIMEGINRCKNRSEELSNI
jgi:pyrroline-5-carboxylate reductase